MLSDIEAGHVNCVIVKDLSRLGRNPIDTGYYIEQYFRIRNIRFIAVNENFDTATPEDARSGIIIPLRNMINEAYALDIGRKIRAQQRQAMKDGKFIGARTPYGYLKAEDDCHQLIIDPVAAVVVQRMFRWASEGAGLNTIAVRLNEAGVLTPSYYKKMQGKITHENLLGSGKWQTRTVGVILRSEVYTGDLVQGQTKTVDHRQVKADAEEWTVVRDTHEAIISRDVFEQVQKQIASRRRQQKDATTQIFAGLVKCADCGWSLSYGENRQNSKPYGHYHCSKYGQGTRQCSMHYIRYDVLYAYVLSRLQYWSGLVQHDEERLLKRLLNANDKGQAAARKQQAAELKKAEKRKAEVDTLFARMYEDWAAGRITEYNFSMLSGKYQSEQAELDEKIERLQSAIATESQNAADAEKWIALMKECVNPTELTAELLNTLIEKIVVHEAVKGEDGSREQEVEIFYRFIGKID